MKHALQCLARLIKVLFGAHSSCCWQVGMRQKPGRARGEVLLVPACALNSCPGMAGGHENVKAGLQVPAQRKQGS